MIDYREVIKNRELRLKLIQLLKYIPNRTYLKLVYRAKTGKRLDLDNPLGYNEKLNWIKINDIHPEYAKLADKLQVREYIKDRLGDGYMFPMLGHWNNFDEIDFTSLPSSFVLKCNHDSGSVKIIHDKTLITPEKRRELSRFFKGRLAMDQYALSREYTYKGIKPCIIAEKLMETEDDVGGIKDYKFFCFNGEPKVMFMVSDRQSTEKHEDYFDMDFNWLPIQNGYTPSTQKPQKPNQFEKMKEVASTLSKGIRTVRIDLYEVKGKVYFGEFTFFPSGGFLLFEPEEWEKTLGDWIRV